jgi:hypothetical protein
MVVSSAISMRAAVLVTLSGRWCGSLTDVPLDTGTKANGTSHRPVRAGKALASRMVREPGDRPIEPSPTLLRDMRSVMDGPFKDPLPRSWAGDFLFSSCSPSHRVEPQTSAASLSPTSMSRTTRSANTENLVVDGCAWMLHRNRRE